MLPQAAFDVVFRIAIDETDICIEAVAAETPVVTEIHVEIVTLFRLKVGAPRFEILVAEEFVGRG